MQPEPLLTRFALFIAIVAFTVSIVVNLRHRTRPYYPADATGVTTIHFNDRPVLAVGDSVAAYPTLKKERPCKQ